MQPAPTDEELPQEQVSGGGETNSAAKSPLIFAIFYWLFKLCRKVESPSTTLPSEVIRLPSRRRPAACAAAWKAERQERIVGHGRCGAARWRRQDGFDTQSLDAYGPLRDTRQRIQLCAE
jgi:hypothetical protein